MYIYSGLLILCLQIYGGKRWTITTITATTTILGITHRATARIHSRITTQIRVTSSLTVQTIIRVTSIGFDGDLFAAGKRAENAGSARG